MNWLIRQIAKIKIKKLNNKKLKNMGNKLIIKQEKIKNNGNFSRI